MNNYQQDLIYNKKPYEYSKEDVKYLRRLLHRDYCNYMMKYVALTIPIADVAVSLLAIFAFGIPLNVMAVLGVFLGVTLTPLFMLMCINGRPSLKELGLTRAEYKELKKSKKIKELTKNVEKYEKSDYAALNDTIEEYEQYNKRINELEKAKQKLLEEQAEVGKIQEEIKREISKNNDGRNL